MTITIVDIDEADLSPVARALIRRVRATSVRQGDIVEFCAPAGIEQIEDAHPRSVSGLELWRGTTVEVGGSAA